MTTTQCEVIENLGEECFELRKFTSSSWNESTVSI